MNCTRCGTPGPGGCACSTAAIIDVTRPLSQTVTQFGVTASPNHRGMVKQIDPPTSGAISSKDVGIVDLRTGTSCVAGELLCVTLGLSLLPKRPGLSDPYEALYVYPSVRAILTWGLGSASFEARCDWMNGTQLSIAADTITVAARYMLNSLPWDPTLEPNAPSFNASAGVGYGNIGRNSNPARLTELVQIEEPEGEAIVEVPPFATSFTVVQLLSGGACELDVYGFGESYFQHIVPSAPLTNVGQYNVENSYPLFNGARRIRVTNKSESDDPLLAFIIFGLAL